jgi:solute carrier family 25 (mitochondrial uncoupling protein), member 8/9
MQKFATKDKEVMPQMQVDVKIPKEKTLRTVSLEWVTAGMGCALADSLMNPLEIIKVRLQMNGGSGSVISMPRLFQEGVDIFKQDGLRGLYVPGLLATAMRGFFYAGFRIGMYPAVRQQVQGMFDSDGDSFTVKLVAGATTGAIGCFIFNPIDVVRVRFQRNPYAYSNTFRAFPTIFKEEGLQGLWAGVKPNVARSAVLSGTQLSTYETLKRMLTKHGMTDNPMLQSFVSVVSGIVAQGVIMPIDVVKTQMILARQQIGTESPGIVSVVRVLFKEGGINAFYRGFAPAVARQVPSMLIQMPVIEHLRKLFGLEYL